MTVPIPTTLEELLTPEWLNAALGTRYPGIEVTRVIPGDVISRVSTNARFTIECAGTLPDGLSPNLCAKGYFTEIGVQSRFAGVPEAIFYREIASPSEIRTLRCVYADYDSESMANVVLTEDVAVQGANFLDARSSYTPDQAAQSLEELAQLHAATWQEPKFAGAAWLDSRMEQYTQIRGIKEISANFDGPVGAGVPDEVRDAQRLYETYSTLAKQIQDESPWSVIHGDAHIGNVYLDAGGRPAFVDWQLVQRGPWYLDVGYHLASALEVEDRRSHERELVAHYLDHLVAGGVTGLDESAVWRGYRRGIVHGFYLWGITFKVDPAITTRLLTRLGTAAADHDSFAAVMTSAVPTPPPG